MSYYCKHCGNRHNKAETAQRCAQRARERAALPEEALLLPSGHYVVEMTGDDGNLYLAHISVAQLDGKWHGRCVVNVYDVDGTVTPVSDPSNREYLAGVVRKFGPRKGLMKFGTEMGKCAICLEELSEEEALKGVHKRNRTCYTEVFG